MTMTTARLRVLLISGWVTTVLLLIYVAGVPAWLAFIGNLAGGVVIHGYAPPVTGEQLSRPERVLRMAAYVLLGGVAGLFILLLVVTMLAFLVAWLAN
jgi:hypothetical protein